MQAPMMSLLATLLLGQTGIALAACPPSCPGVNLAFDTTFTWDSGDFHREKHEIIELEVPLAHLLDGGSGSVVVQVDPPWHTGDPGNSRMGLTIAYRWIVDDEFYPAEVSVGYPDSTYNDLLRPDPFRKPPVIKFLPPTPIDWYYRPGLSFQDRELKFTFGHTFFPAFLNNGDGMPPPDTPFDRWQIDYTVQSTVVPEPFVWAYLVSGFASIGVMARRSQRRGRGHFGTVRASAPGLQS